MANYIINQCLTNDEYIISAVTLTSGATIEFDISEARFCGTVGAVTENAETLNISFISLHTDCCSCLSGLTESLNFKFIQCGTENEINIEAFNFCDQFGSPTTGLTYEIQSGSETPFCATFEGLSPTGETNYSYISGPFLLCEECGEEPPRSANTETLVCVTCCPCDGTSGSTFSVVPPHPVWTDGYGTPVTQLNMIVIGGINGLNG
jgi:hypothetical protein